MLKFRPLVVVSAGAVIALGYGLPATAQAVFPFRSSASAPDPDAAMVLPAVEGDAVPDDSWLPRTTEQPDTSDGDDVDKVAKAPSPALPDDEVRDRITPPAAVTEPAPSQLAASWQAADDAAWGDSVVVRKQTKPGDLDAIALTPPSPESPSSVLIPRRAMSESGMAIAPMMAAEGVEADGIEADAIAPTKTPDDFALSTATPIAQSDPDVDPAADPTEAAPPNNTFELPTPENPFNDEAPFGTTDELNPEPVEPPAETPAADPESTNEIPAADPEPVRTLPDPGESAQLIGPDDLQAVSTPDYLNPSQNPLLFPTEVDEVTIDITQPITLQEAIALARRNNTDLQTARLNLDRAYTTLEETKAGRLPTVDGSLGLTRTNSASGELQREAAGALSQALGNDDSTSDTLTADVEVNYNLFDGGRTTALIREAEHRIRVNQLEVERLTEQIHLDTTNAYYQLQERDQRVGIEQQAVDQALQTLRDAELLQQAGLGTRFDVIRAQVDLANSQQALTQANAEQKIAQRELVQVLALGQQVNVTIADEIKPVQPWELSLEETIVLAYRNRAELEQQLIQREINEAQRTVALAAVRPQVSLFANYNLLEQLDDDQGLADGYSIGARVQWRFFDGGAARAQRRGEEIDIELAEVAFEEQRNTIRLEVETAYENSIANQQNIRTASAAVQLAEESLRLARLRFQAGVGTQTDVIDAQTELTRARGNLLTAIVTYNRSIAALQRAVSNVPDNRLFDLP
jgi:outer membrane protein TolC